MQNPQPTAEIPELGGLPSSRLSELADQGLAARRDVSRALGRARRRARALAAVRALALILAGEAVGVGAGALLGSVAPAVVARIAAGLLAAAALAGTAVFCLRSPFHFSFWSRSRGGSTCLRFRKTKRVR